MSFDIELIYALLNQMKATFQNMMRPQLKSAQD